MAGLSIAGVADAFREQRDALADLLVRHVRIRESQVLDVFSLAVKLAAWRVRDAGLVIDEKRGYYVHYRINEKALVQWHERINQIMAPKANQEELTSKKGKNKCVAAREKTRVAKSRKT